MFILELKVWDALCNFYKEMRTDVSAFQLSVRSPRKVHRSCGGNPPSGSSSILRRCKRLARPRRRSACNTLFISAAYGGLRSGRASHHFSAKASASLRRHSEHGRCPAANAVGSSRKNSRRRLLKSSTQQIHCLDPNDAASACSCLSENTRRGCP
jgi:hypothetical protein